MPVHVVSLLASDCLDKAVLSSAWVDGGAVVALTAGEGPSRNTKDQENEDSVGCHVSEDGRRVAVVADSHWGAKAGELAVVRVLELAEDLEPDQDDLARALLDVDAAVVRRKPAGDESETTVLVAVQSGRDLVWASIGDSQLWVVSGTSARRLNEDRHLFAGGRSPAKRRLANESPSRFVERGSTVLSSGERVLLASDGLSPLDSGVDPSELPDAVGPKPDGLTLLERVTALAERARKAPAGGRDNVALVLIDPR